MHPHAGERRVLPEGQQAERRHNLRLDTGLLPFRTSGRRKFGHEDVLQWLLDRSPEPVKLIEACWLGDEAMVHSLRAKLPNPAASFTDSDRRQVAHAARNNETTVVRLMLECGLPVDARGQHQATPLHWAAFHGNVEMARIVLHYGPPLEARDADFNGTPLGWAIHGSENGWHCETGDFGGTVEALMMAGENLRHYRRERSGSRSAPSACCD